MMQVPDWVLIVVGFGLIAAVFVVLPYSLTLGSWFRQRRPVTCPETGSSETVAVGLARQVVYSVFPVCEPTRLCDCTRWPERSECDQACTRQL